MHVPPTAVQADMFPSSAGSSSASSTLASSARRAEEVSLLAHAARAETQARIESAARRMGTAYQLSLLPQRQDVKDDGAAAVALVRYRPLGHEHALQIASRSRASERPALVQDSAL